MMLLILGFQRSGTTLLRRLVNAHPNAKILHEKRLVRHAQNIDQMRRKMKIFNLDMVKYGGEKVPWYNNHGNDADRFIDKWFDFFGKKGRVVHIVHHPIDVAYSNVQRRYAKSLSRPLTWYTNSVPRIVEKVEKHPKCMNIIFEDLVYSPRAEIERVFNFCGIEYNPEILIKVLDAPMRYFKGVNSDRGYAFKKEGKEIPTKVSFIDYNELLKRINNGQDINNRI